MRHSKNAWYHRVAFRWVLLILLAISCSNGNAATTRLGTDTEAPPQRLALLIGNSTYEHLAKLKNPKNDVEQLAAKLRDLGFDASIEYDLNHDDFVNALSTFENRIAPGDIVLFYYSGHGVQVGGTNYLVPVNMPSGANATTLQGSGISLSLVRNALTSSRLSLIILDACRTISNLPIKGGPEGLAPLFAKGSLIAYAADEGQAASDNDAEDVSLFTKHLIQELGKHDETLCQLFGSVRQAVDAASGHVQFPFVYDGVIGEFVFNRTTTAESKKVSHIVNTEGPTKAWTIIKMSDNPNDFAAFLAARPQEPNYEKTASSRLTSLMSSTATAAGVVPIQQSSTPNRVALSNQAQRLFYERAYERAAAVYQRLVESDPSDALALYDHGTCLIHLGKYDEAVDSLTKAISANPDFPWAYHNRGVAYQLNKTFEPAMNDYAAVIARKPSYAPAYNNLAIIRREAGDLDSAEQDAKMAIDLNGKFAPAFFNGAAISMKIGNVAEAAEFERSGKRLTISGRFFF